MLQVKNEIKGSIDLFFNGHQNKKGKNAKLTLPK
jgi:hypothetical protein